MSTPDNFDVDNPASGPVAGTDKFLVMSNATKRPAFATGTQIATFIGSNLPLDNVTSASANALSVGLNGATNPAFNVDASTASQVAGLQVKGAVHNGTVAVSVLDSSGAANLTINALSTGTIGIGSVSTGAVTITPATTITGAATLTGGATVGAGTTAVAPILLTSGTNLTTAAAGATEYDGKVFYQTSVASSRQVVDTEQFVCLAANGPTDNNTLLDSATAAAVFRTPTNGTITLAGSTSYFFEAIYKLSNTGTTSHTWATLFAGGATLTSISYTALAYTGTTSGVTLTALSAAQIGVATQVPVTAASTSATEFVTVILKGIVRVNGAGTFIPQMQASARPGASGTPGVIILAGSYFRIWPLGVDTVASVGNWS